MLKKKKKVRIRSMWVRTDTPYPHHYLMPVLHGGMCSTCTQRCSDDSTGRLLDRHCLCIPGGCTETCQLLNCPLQGMIQPLFLLIAQCFPFVLLKFYSELGHKRNIQPCNRIIRCCKDGGRNKSMTASSVWYHIFFNVTLFKLLFSN